MMYVKPLYNGDPLLLIFHVSKIDVVMNVNMYLDINRPLFIIEKLFNSFIYYGVRTRFKGSKRVV